MTSTKIDDKGLVNLPIGKDWIAFPILNVFLRPVDNATGKMLNRFVFSTNESQQVFEARGMTLMWRAAHENHAGV